MDESGTVVLNKENGVATISLSRPEKLNALSPSMRRSLGKCVAEVADDPDVKVVVLRAEGRSFCVGADLVDAPQTPLDWRDRIMTAQECHLAIALMRKPVIAAVQGAAVGGGASLALAADILVMADDAKLVFPFVRLGLVPDGGVSFFLQAKLHGAAALDFLLTGGTMTAEEAYRLGLTRRVVPASRLDETALTLASEMSKLPWEATMLTKSVCAQYWAQGVERGFSHEADAFALASTTEGHKAAMAAIRQKLKREGGQ